MAKVMDRPITTIGIGGTDYEVVSERECTHLSAYLATVPLATRLEHGPDYVIHPSGYIQAKSNQMVYVPEITAHLFSLAKR